MPKVYIPTLLRHTTGGCAELDVEGATVREVIANLEARFPGVQDRVMENGRLRPSVSVAIDGEITPLGLLELVTPSSEVHFLTAIRGG